jgi:hypothetical protein
MIGQLTDGPLSWRRLVTYLGVKSFPDQTLGGGQNPLQSASQLVRRQADRRYRPSKVTGCLRANAVTPFRKSSVWPQAAMAWASSSICVSRLS